MKETWLVTGSSVGLGRSIVEAALAEGHNVVATARHPRTLDDLASQFPDQLLAQRLEVTDGRNARDVVEATIERFGRLDVLVNNAGFAGWVRSRIRRSILSSSNSTRISWAPSTPARRHCQPCVRR